MSSLATLYALHKRLGVTVLLRKEQAMLLQYYFNFSQSDLTVFHTTESYLRRPYLKYKWMTIYKYDKAKTVSAQVS